MPLKKELERGEEFIENMNKSELGGTTGAIFTAKISGTGEEVIVKEIKYEDSNHKDMIINREVAFMSNLSHDHIVKFHGYTVKDDCVRIVLENLKGGDVEQAYKRGLNDKQKVRILLHVAKGLEYLHEKSLMHRDIKPQNILLDRIALDLDFTAKIADFGVSRNSESTTTITGIAGTCAYKAPEQFKKIECNLKLDIYSFAVLTHELICEKAPYTDDKTKRLNQSQLAMHISTKGLRPEKFVKFPTETNEDLVAMVRRNWDEDSEKRMSAKELVESLENIYNSF
jgi:serine/threonine protein kinase